MRTKQNNQNRKVAGINIGSASLVMVFSVLCLTIFAVLSVVTARNAWSLAEKSAAAVTAYYEADSIAVQVLDEITANYHGGLDVPEGHSGQLEFIDGQVYLSYYIPIDDRQDLWVQLLDAGDHIQVVHWTVQESVDWETDDQLVVWEGMPMF